MKYSSKIKRAIYGVTLLFITLSGFGQMPVFKRYYIADIPGLGWLAQFYVTHTIHYICASVLIALAGYVLVNFFLDRSGRQKLTGYGYLKISMLAGLIVSGALMVIKNLPDVYFAHGLIIALDLIHLSLCMMLLIVSLYSVIRREKWVDQIL